MPADTNRPTLIYCVPSVEIKLLQPMPYSFIFYYQRFWKLLVGEVIIGNKINGDKWFIGAQINMRHGHSLARLRGEVVSRVNFCTAPEIGYKYVFCAAGGGRWPSSPPHAEEPAWTRLPGDETVERAAGAHSCLRSLENTSSSGRSECDGPWCCNIETVARNSLNLFCTHWLMTVALKAASNCFIISFWTNVYSCFFFQQRNYCFRSKKK